MQWKSDFIAVDWGTTNRRAWLVGPDGAVKDQVQDGLGILNVPAGTFEATALQLRARLGHHPLLLAGMIGSNLGWKQAAYAACPAGLSDLKQALCWMAEDIAIVPGVSFRDGDRADIMRGEELQILGAVAARSVPADAIVWPMCRMGRNLPPGSIGRCKAPICWQTCSVCGRAPCWMPTPRRLPISSAAC
jgi:2-dehydro-3-deoxygalactonokinase